MFLLGLLGSDGVRYYTRVFHQKPRIQRCACACEGRSQTLERPQTIRLQLLQKGIICDKEEAAIE